MSPVVRQAVLNNAPYKFNVEDLDNFLYVGGVKVASNLETLLDNKITHIINCVGHKCENLWPDHFEYLTYKIPDNGTDICPYLREAFEFIENAKRKHGKILIHCVKEYRDRQRQWAT